MLRLRRHLGTGEPHVERGGGARTERPSTDAADFDVAFASAEPDGAAPTITEFSGEVYNADGTRHRIGGRVEAFVGTTSCGVATIRSSEFYILNVVGPDAVTACTAARASASSSTGSPRRRRPRTRRTDRRTWTSPSPAPGF